MVRGDSIRTQWTLASGVDLSEFDLRTAEESNLLEELGVRAAVDYIRFEIAQAQIPDNGPHLKRRRIDCVEQERLLRDVVEVVDFWEDVACVDLFSEAGEPDQAADVMEVESDSDIEMTRLSEPSRDKWARIAFRFGLDPLTFQTLVRAGAPPILFNLIKFLHDSQNTTNERDLDLVEFYSGASEIWKRALARGQHAGRFDRNLSKIFQDVLLYPGFLSMLQLARRCGSGSSSTWAPLCSSWIWLCRRVTCRSKTSPLGCEDGANKCVREGNLMVSRNALVQLFLLARPDHYLWEEQPGDSVMYCHPRKKMLRQKLEAGLLHGKFHMIHTWMGAFWAPNPKSTRIWGNSVQVQYLKRTLTRSQITALGAVTRTYTFDELRASLGLSAVTGVPANLKRSQQYPVEFAEASVDAWLRIRHFALDVHADPRFPFPAGGQFCFDDLWEDCELRPLADALGLPFDRLAV